MVNKNNIEYTLLVETNNTNIAVLDKKTVSFNFSTTGFRNDIILFDTEDKKIFDNKTDAENFINDHLFYNKGIDVYFFIAKNVVFKENRKDIEVFYNNLNKELILVYTNKRDSNLCISVYENIDINIVKEVSNSYIITSKIKNYLETLKVINEDENVLTYFYESSDEIFNENFEFENIDFANLISKTGITKEIKSEKKLKMNF